MRVIRFATFELDVRAGELRNGAEKVRLQEQPYRILTMLLERPGEVVLREEICKRLWPNGTVVEVSHGINAAVLRLRDALGDSADRPRFVETVARRGYRFVAPVEVECRRAPSAVSAPALPSPDLLAGQAVSHFRLEEKLGSGGMGVVYRAEDVNLSRPVALKFLAPEMAGDPLAVSRFQREARTASALNHPNICTVYSVEECAGQPVIVMELVEGRTLEALLAEGPLPASRALPLAVQMAAALEAAHRKGIVHRDLKPGNVMVTQFGVKVLDFGLAKHAAGNSTAPSGLTRTGSLVGTPSYMAPELFQGREADSRSDLYSFGVVLLEMLAGAGAVASAAPPLPSGAADLEPLLRRALEPNPQNRWQTAGDLKAALECAAAARLALSPPPRAALSLPPWMPKAALAVSASALALAAIWFARPAPSRQEISPSRQPLTQTAAAARNDRPPMLPAAFGVTPTRPPVTGKLNLSPNGRLLAVAAAGEIYVRPVDGNDIVVLASRPGLAGTPFWSPDSRALAFTNGGRLYTVPLQGGALKQVGEANTNISGAWGPDGTILIGDVRGGLMAIPSAGGMARRLTVPDTQAGETRHLLPQFLPGGRRFLYTAGTEKAGAVLYASSLDKPADRVAIMPVESGAVFMPRAGSQGYLLFTHSGDLMAQAFDAAALRTSGPAMHLSGRVNGTRAANAQAVTVAEFSATPSVLAYHGASGVTVLRDWMSSLAH